ncbi:MAG: HAD-IIB family hydrolase [Planctomycetota bacterium]
MPWTLASDIDGTLTGDPHALAELAQALTDKREAGELYLILCTGRRLQQVIDGFATEGLPFPDAVIGQVGTEIYLPPFTPDSPRMAAWDERLHRVYRRETALSFVEGIDGIEIQPEVFNTPLKASFYLDNCPDPEAAVATVRERAQAAGEGYMVVWSSGRDLDILPAVSGKGKAVHFLVEHEGLDQERIAVAGDSGNDIAMFEECRRGVVVGNARSELKTWARDHAAKEIHQADASYAAGVAEGLRALDIL